MAEKPNWFANDLGAIPPRVMAELESAGVERGRPLIAVDADEVLVHFAEHFAEWLEALGYSFRLTEYKLASAIRSAAGEVLTKQEIAPLVWSFIEGETARQRAIDGAVEALSRLAGSAQIVVLTNAPSMVRAARVTNLGALGMNYPVVMNEGGKGRALQWLAERADAPVAFIDDSAEQLDSAAKLAIGVKRFHLVGSSMLKPVIGRADTAEHHPEDWREAETMVLRALGA
ncbi:MAG: hypothetical protein WD969_07760 [Paracoccaceae bacterium]